MKKEQAMVREFHKLAKAYIKETPTFPAEDCITLRLKLINEEFKELQEAFNAEMVNNEVYHFLSKEKDLVEVADAIGDLLYVILGTAVSCGIDIEPIFHEIHRSNMTKFIDGHCRADGKWVKGPAYTPPDLAPLLKTQSVLAESQP